MSLLSALFGIAIFQGLVLGVIILRSPIFRSDANKYLAYAVMGLSFALLSLAYELTEDYPEDFLPFIIDIFSSGALFPVLVLLFIVNQVDHPIRRSGKRWWWFLPHFSSVALSGLNAIVDFASAPLIVKVLFDAAEVSVFLLILVFIPGILLYGYSFLKYADSSREKRWLTQLWFWVFAIMASWVSSIVFAMFSYINMAWMLRTIALGASFLIHWITYAGIFKFKLSKDQEEIRALISKWKSGSLQPALSTSSPPPRQSEEKQEPSFTEENDYFRRLETLCANERIYLDPSLDRAKVAEMLGISPGYVSQLVNSITGDNFSTYINRYRVEAVKAMIASAEFDNYSLLAIGLESGFSSKTTFHTAFKKMTGMTPNGYRKAHS
ncbi:AraC family transcriptional regulator [Neolewinella agarilytica]|uniref:Helix-turn-helix domain-containing protein n=1 Tax=Neolewinella agarilytica TaxID=478744 RepID=A0A1H9HQ26_9BACT|nr:helix-turn-helix domain-containing protein [Neolewinella agarilytica]SEQ64376.1 Helix-turn-helix domain-containing protein [Neolewinella agarilytica]